MKTRLPTLTLLAALAGTLPQMAAASQVLMDFEGIIAAGETDGVSVGNYYNNPLDPAHDFNVDFVASGITSAVALKSREESGGSGNFPVSSNPGTAIASFSGNLLEFTANDGFNILTFDYSILGSDGRVEISGFTDSTPIIEPDNSRCQPNLPFCEWRTQTIDLGSALGKHVTFSASSGQFLFDNIRLTTNGNGGGGGTVPEPTSLALVALALAGVGAATRRRPGA